MAIDITTIESTHYPKIEGLNLALGRRRYKMPNMQEEFDQWLLQSGRTNNS
jgi:hypothetical protein